MGIFSSDYGSNWDSLGKSKDPKAPKREDYTQSGAGLFVENVGVSTAQGALAGSAFGVPGALVGGAIGMTVGLFGMQAEAQKQEMDFQKAYGAYKSGKDRAKMAEQAAKQQFQAQKSRAGKKGRTPDLPAVAAYDADIMRLEPGAGTSQYDQFLGNTYGYTA